MGTQKGEFEGKVRMNRKIRIGFELPDEKAVFSEEHGEQPFLVDMTLNLSSSEKSNFVKTMTAWFGKAPEPTFDIEELLGKAGMVNVSHKKVGNKTYANITSVTPVPKSLLKTIGDPENKPTYWSVENGKDAAYDKLPDFLKAMALASQEWNTEGPDDAAASKPDDDGQPPFDEADGF